jgi:hypothetical protein
LEALQKKAMRVKFQVEGQKTGLKPKTVGLTAWTDDATLSRARALERARNIMDGHKLTKSGWLNPHPFPDIAFCKPMLVCFSEA